MDPFWIPKSGPKIGSICGPKNDPPGLIVKFFRGVLDLLGKIYRIRARARRDLLLIVKCFRGVWDLWENVQDPGPEPAGTYYLSLNFFEGSGTYGKNYRIRARSRLGLITYR